jgi:hypothetical protein
MRTFRSITQLTVILSATLSSNFAWATTTYAPTSFEVLYQPTYSMPKGGPSSQVGAVGGGIRIGYAMTSLIAFELGGYYNGYVFGDIAGAKKTAYAARATGDFAFAPSPNFRFYLGADANAFINPPSDVTRTGDQDIGIIGGFRLLVGGSNTKVVLGAEYRYALATALTYTGGTINTSAVLGTIGLHFGGL